MPISNNPLEYNATVVSTRMESNVGNQVSSVAATQDTKSTDGLLTTGPVLDDSGYPSCNVSTLPNKETEGETSDVEYPTDSSVGFQYEDEYYTDDDRDDKRMRGKL